jgi:ABC-2 type transport system permease protein
MIKYFHFARMAFLDFARHHVRLLTRLCVYLLLAWVMTAMWRVIYEAGHGPAGISLHDMGWYNAIVQMMFFLSPRLFIVIDEDVRSGNIGYFLNRPIPYLWMRLSEGLGSLLVHLIMFYTIGVACIYAYLGGWPSGGVSVLVASLGLLVGGSILHLCFQICCGLSTFWTNDAVFVYNAYMKIILLLGGIYIPVHLYPSFMPVDLMLMLPFAAMVGMPSALLIGEGTVWSVLSLQIFWLVVMMMFMHWLYKICLRKVEIHGG